MPVCPHCGHETDERVEECPLCGSALARAPGEGRPTTGGRPAPAGGAGETGRSGAAAVPWEDPEGGVFGGLLRSWTLCLFEPERFFAAVDHEGPLARPLLYFVIVAAISGFFSVLWQTLFQSALGLPQSPTGSSALLLSFFITPFLLLFLLVVGGGLIHLSALLVAGERVRPAGATYRVCCYAASPLLLSVVPIAGNLLAPGWSLVVLVIGLRETHGTNTGRSVVAALAPVVLFVLLMMLLVGFALSTAELQDLYGPSM